MPLVSDLLTLGRAFGTNVRGAAVSNRAYQEKGIGGVIDALGNPQPYEESAQDAKFRDAYAPTIQAIDEHVKAGDFEKGLIGVSSLQQQMKDNNARPADIQRFAGGYMQQVFQAGVAAKPMNTPAGQDFAVQGAATVNPELAGNAATVAAGLPEKRLGAAKAEADIAGTQARTENTKTLTALGIPAQAAANYSAADLRQSQAGAYDRGEMKRVGSAAGNLNAIMTRNLGVVQKYDHDLQKMLTDPLAMSNPNAINGLLDQRNMAARSLSATNPGAPAIPELELTQIVDPNADSTKPLADRQSFALRVKQPQQQPSEQTAAPSRQAHAMPQAAPLQTQDPNAGLAPRQQRPDFRAAVGNPMGALPAELQAQLQDPTQIVSAKVTTQSFIQQGFSPDQADALTNLLLEQMNGWPANQSPAPGSPGPGFMPPTTPTPQLQPGG